MEQSQIHNRIDLVLAKLTRMEALFEAHLSSHEDIKEDAQVQAHEVKAIQSLAQKHDAILKASIWIFCTLGSLVTAKYFIK